MFKYVCYFPGLLCLKVEHRLDELFVNYWLWISSDLLLRGQEQQKTGSAANVCPDLLTLNRDLDISLLFA